MRSPQLESVNRAFSAVDLWSSTEVLGRCPRLALTDAVGVLTILMPRLIRWNFSSRARELSGGDAIVVSIPKSGRTWVRTFLCAYFCKRYGYPFSLQPEQSGDARIPRIIYSHDRFEQRTKADRWD